MQVSAILRLMAQKTEKATPKKLRDAMRKGQVAKSQDFPAAFTFAVSLAATLCAMPFLFRWVGGFLLSIFSNIHKLSGPDQLPALFWEAALVILKASVPICLVTAITGMIVHFVATGPVWAPEIFKPDIKKFNPIDNLKAKFKLKTWFELIKSLFKICGACVIMYFTLMRAIGTLTTTCKLPLIEALVLLSHFIFEVVWQVGIFFVVVAVADLIFQKQSFAKEMKMEKFEVKQEFKNTDGNPEIKGKRKQLFQEIAYQEGPASTMSKARAVITNPTHLAIAIGYERELDPAPFICMIGKETVAKLIIKEAEKQNIPVLRNIGLAHTLWEEGEEWEYVPEHTFEAMAAILKWLESLEASHDSDEEELLPELPEGFEPQNSYASLI